MKTRSDQRVYDGFAYSFLRELLDKYPCFADKGNQKNRIVSVNGSWEQAFECYWIQDFFFFGTTEDILNYFDAPYDDRNIHSPKDYLVANGMEKFSIEDHLQLRVPEIYLTKNYLERQGEILDDSVENSWNIIRERFLVIERSEIKLFWNKYAPGREYRNNCHYKFKETVRETDQPLNLKFCINLLNGNISWDKYINNGR
jgi:hypothetical protein